jgi:hypothetical protein
MDQTDLNFFAELQLLITQREGMIAENQRRLSVDNSISYGEECFEELSSQMRREHQSYLMEKRNK